MTYHNFTFQPGYVESSTLCTMAISHAIGFTDAEQALESFRLCLVDYLTIQMCQHVKKQKPCCQNHMGNSEYHFCPVCGYNLQAQVEPSPFDVQEAFMEMPMTTCDGGADMLRHFEAAGWYLGYLHPVFEGEVPVLIQAVGRWMGRDTEGSERPYCEANYPDGSGWNSRQK